MKLTSEDISGNEPDKRLGVDDDSSGYPETHEADD
jgi:hypothetical protein